MLFPSEYTGHPFSLTSFLVLYLVISCCPSHTHPLLSALQHISSVVLCRVSEDRVDYCIMSFRYMFMKWDIGVRRYVDNSVYVRSSIPGKGGWMDGYSCEWMTSLRNLNLLFLWAVTWNIKCVHWWASDSTFFLVDSLLVPCWRGTVRTEVKSSRKNIFTSTWSKDCILHLL